MTKTELEELRKLKYKIMRRLLDEAKMVKSLKKEDTRGVPHIFYDSIIQSIYENMKTVKIEFENYLGF